MTYDWTVPSLLAQGVKYYPNKSSDGVVDVRVFLTQVAKLLQDGLEYLGEAGTTSKELQAAIDAIPVKADSSVAWVAAARAWMTFLDNARITSKVPYPATPDNLPKLHGKKCWKNVQHYKQCPARVTTNFTGGAVTSNHVFVYQNTDKGWVKLDKSPDASGRYNMEDVEGTEVCILRDTRTYGEKDSTDGTIWAVTSPTPQQMRDIAKWTMLATMDAGGVSTEVPKDKGSTLTPRSRIDHITNSSGLPPEILQYAKDLLFKGGWGTFLDTTPGGRGASATPGYWNIKSWMDKGLPVPEAGDILLVYRFLMSDDKSYQWYVGTSPCSDCCDVWTTDVLVKPPEDFPQAATAWKVPVGSGWTARSGLCGLYLSKDADLTDPSVKVHTYHVASVKSISGSRAPWTVWDYHDKYTYALLRVPGDLPATVLPFPQSSAYWGEYMYWTRLDQVKTGQYGIPHTRRRTNMAWYNYQYHLGTISGYYTTDLTDDWGSCGTFYKSTDAPSEWQQKHDNLGHAGEISPGVFVLAEDITVNMELGLNTGRFALSWYYPDYDKNP